MRAICIRCGATKDEPWATCPECDFTPTGDDLVKSVYCSVERFTALDDQNRYAAELVHMTETIRGGGLITYDPNDLHRLRTQQQMIESTPMSAVWGAVFRLFLPGVLFLALLLVVLGLLKWFRSS